MNKEYVLWNLREAYSAVGQMIAECESDPEYERPEFAVDMQHLYHHINTAWNAQDSSAERAKRCEEGDFMEWRQFPQDIDMSV